ncbi:MAG: hypothetical protein JWO36_2725 [Myxococcales bacterium]|nr:hypothetical protein [Myxococcales bacterium]
MMADRESPLPFVVGVLMILFGGIGLWLDLHAVSAGRDVVAGVPRDHALWSSLLIAGVAVAVLHINAGIRAMLYRRDATNWAIIYAVASLATTLCVFVLTPDQGTRDSYGKILDWVGIVPAERNLHDALSSVRTIVSIAWPLVVVFAMTRKSVRTACGRIERTAESPRARLH